MGSVSTARGTGTMFLPQVVLAILASELAPKFARRWSLRRVLLVGFAGNLVSMALLSLSRLLLGAPDVAFGVLLAATGALGLGFGATIMALNTYAETLFPESADRAVLVLNALLGLGTALAPGTGRNRRRDRRMVAAPGRSGVHSGADLWCCSDRTAESPCTSGIIEPRRRMHCGDRRIESECRASARARSASKGIAGSTSCRRPCGPRLPSLHRAT